MSLLKIHRKISWRNREDPAINERNLNQYDHELDVLDDRIIQLNATTLPAQTAGGFITNFDVNPADGVITITYFSGRSVRIDTNLEKIPLKYRFDEDRQTLYFIADDGTEQKCNLSSLIGQNEFRDSDSITFAVVDGIVTAQVKRGSITAEMLQPNFLAQVQTEAARALAGADAAAESVIEVKGSAKSAQTAAQAAESAQQESERHAAAARASADAAAISKQGADDSAIAAEHSKEAAKTSELTTLEYKEATEESAQESADSAHIASTKADESINSASIAVEQALLAQSYATGTEGSVRPGDATDNSKFFSDLAKQLTNDAQRLLDQATKLVSAASVGAIIPAGTVAFADLPPAPTVGYMYNISDAFTTDARFVEGAGVNYNAGANIYWTKDGQWDVMIGVQVTGVKGDAEPDYHQGNVNITPASIGLGNVNNTADADKVVKAAGTATKALQDANGNNIADTYLTKTGDTKDDIVTFSSNDTNPPCWTDIGLLQSGEKHSSIFNKLSTMFRNVRYIWQLIGNTQLSVGDGTVTGAINALNAGLRATCKYYQSNDASITDDYIYVGTKGVNTAEYIFEYSLGGILIKIPGTYIIESHFHFLASANDVIEVFMELTGDNRQSSRIYKTVCVPTTMQTQCQIIHIINVDIITSICIHFRSATGKSNVFTAVQTNANYLTIKRIC